MNNILNKESIILEISNIMDSFFNFTESDYTIGGSFRNKSIDDINDIDIILYSQKDIFKFNTLIDTLENINKLEDIIRRKDAQIKINEYNRPTAIFSFDYKIKNRVFPFELIPVVSKEWGEFNFLPPPENVSNYKLMYKNALLKAIATSIKFNFEYYSKSEETKCIKEGDIKSYTRYKYLRNVGLWKVKETNIGTYILRYKKNHCTPVSHNVDEVIKLLLGEYITDKYITVEKIVDIISKPNWIHRELLPTILENYKIIVQERQRNKVPDIVKNIL